MTNNEAISKIKFLLDVGGSDGFTNADKEAFNMAINALSERENPKTNGDKIRQMSDEELAEWLDEFGNCRCCADIPTRCHMECCSGHMEWLKQEADKDAGTD